MPELNSTLDTVLGFVTIVLVLSLIIQSFQNIIKRLLRMKSRQAEQSLRLLFDYALDSAPTKYKEMKYASPILAVFTNLFRTRVDSVGDTLVKAVKGEVLEMGRKSYWGRAILDSVSREDVTKILKAVDPKVLGIDTDAIKKSIQAGQNAEEEVTKAIYEKVRLVETWYDTVMPGVAERYERGMKWVAVALSVLVVVMFNANAIEIYRYVASDSAVQKQLIDYGEKLKADRKPVDTSTQQESEQDKAKRIKAETEDDIKSIKTLSSDLSNFGLTFFKWDKSFTDSSTGWRTLLGWLAMTLLLSLGAPFWEDALESLFGLKNTLRGKGKEEQKKAQ